MKLLDDMEEHGLVKLRSWHLCLKLYLKKKFNLYALTFADNPFLEPHY